MSPLRLAGRAQGAGTRAGALFVLLFACWLLGGCALLLPQSTALRDQWPAGTAERVDLDAVPFFPQRDYECGPASLATVMAFAGIAVTPDDLVPKVYLPERRGSLQVEMLAAPRASGLVSWKLAPRLDDLLREVAAGAPVIVLQDYGVWPLPYWHYAVVVGFDRERRTLVLRSGEKRRLEVPFSVFEYTWKESGYWAMAVVPAGRVAVTAGEDAWLAATAAMERVAARADARKAYDALVQRWPDNLIGAVALANIDHAAGHLAAAESVLRAAVLRHPGSALALNNLAQVVSDSDRPAEALGLIDQAIALGGPFVANAQDTRAQILRKLQSAKP